MSRNIWKLGLNDEALQVLRDNNITLVAELECLNLDEINMLKGMNEELLQEIMFKLNYWDDFKLRNKNLSATRDMANEPLSVNSDNRDDLTNINGMETGSTEDITVKTDEYINNPTYNNVTLEDASNISDEFYESEGFAKLFEDKIEQTISEHGDCATLLDIRSIYGWGIPESAIIKQLNRLVEVGKIISSEEGYKYNYPSILEAMKVLPEKYQIVLKQRLDGASLQDIADKYDVTRQRVDQVIKKAINAIFNGTKNIEPISRVQEDSYRHQFELYNISLSEWIEVLNQPEYAFHYLCLRYKKGERLLPGVERHQNNVINRVTHSVIHKTDISNNGTIEAFLNYYRKLDPEERVITLYSDEEQYKKEILRLHRRVNREIRKKKYISDIKITEYEYELLRGYLHYAFTMTRKTGIAPDDAMFVTAITNVAIRVYKDGNFWSNFTNEIKQSNNSNYQVVIGNKYYEILERFELAKVEKSKYVQNILMHCFVSNNYANAYFEFLFNFYRIDLDRDLNRLDTETMHGLMDSICADDNAGRTYMLVQHIGQAMAANRRGATIRIRNHMKLLDKLFWDENFEIKSNHRIYNLMQNWARTSKDVIGDMEAYTTGRKRGAKRFSAPYLSYDDANDVLKLVIPSQSIKQVEADNIYWKVSGGVERTLPVELTESVIGYKVLETKCIVPWENALDSFQIELRTNREESIKKFNIKRMDVRLFDSDGCPVNSNNIKTGEVTSVSRQTQEVKSSALYDFHTVNGMLISYFSFEYEDILHMPDGHMVIIGKPDITNSIVGKGRVPGARCFVDDKEYPLYGKLPYLVLRMRPQKFPGTSIRINDIKHRLSDLDYEQFALDDRTEDEGYYLNLASYFGDKDGINKIAVDIPGGSAPSWEFVYIHDFDVEFDEAPYVFEPRGTVAFPEHIVIKEIEDFCDKEPNINGYKFIIKEVNRTLDFITVVDDRDVSVSIDVPALFIKGEDGEWDSNMPAPVWHSELPDIIDLAVPYHKVTLYMDDVFSENTGESSREVTYRKNNSDDHILCDITRFKSYLSGDDEGRQLRIKFGDIDTNLFTIIIHSKVISLQAIGDFEKNTITINAVISGKSIYYIDIRKDGQNIANKLQLIDGTTVASWDITNGIYEIEVFESEADDSGFGDTDYYSIGVYEQELLNPFDMTGKAFKIIQIEDKNNPLIVSPLKYVYYIQDLAKTDDSHVYNGMMITKKSHLIGSEIAACPVSVYFDNLQKPNYVWITFIDEYGDNTEFLYDTRKLGILQEENHILKPLTCYRRYTMLNEDESIFHIDFVTPSKYDYLSLPENIEFPEGYGGIKFKTSFYKSSKGGFDEYDSGIHHKKERVKDARWSVPIGRRPEGGVLLENAGLTNRTYWCFKNSGINNLDELANMTEREVLSLDRVGKSTLNEMRKKMASYGMRFKDK